MNTLQQYNIDNKIHPLLITDDRIPQLNNKNHINVSFITVKHKYDIGIDNALMSYLLLSVNITVSYTTSRCEI